MSYSRQQTLCAVLRKDFPSFVGKCFATLHDGQAMQMGPHIYALCHALSEAEAGREHRLAVNMPPRHLKSIIASVAFSAWILGRDPGARIICVSHSQELADKFSNQTRTIMESDWYQAIFPNTRIDQRKNATSEFATTAQGFRLATSIGGSITGRGGQYIIIDDPAKPDEIMSEAKRRAINFWYGNTLYSRLDDKRQGVIVLVMQRLHENDLTAHVLKAGEWRHIKLPAVMSEDLTCPIGPGRTHTWRSGEVLHEARESRQTLEEIRAQLGSFSFSAQYLQEPVPREGGLFQWHRFNLTDAVPDLADCDVVYQSWDTASMTGEGNDYSACMTWGIRDGKFCLLDAVRARVEYPALVRLAREKYRQFHPRFVLIEHSGSGIPLCQTLRADGIHNVWPVRPRGEKRERAGWYALPAIEAGLVFFPRNAPWFEEVKAEILAFPNGSHDDYVDCMTQFLQRADEDRRRRMPPMRANPVRRQGAALPRPSREIERPDPFNLFGPRMPFRR